MKKDKVMILILLIIFSIISIFSFIKFSRINKERDLAIQNLKIKYDIDDLEFEEFMKFSYTNEIKKSKGEYILFTYTNNNETSTLLTNNKIKIGFREYDMQKAYEFFEKYKEVYHKDNFKDTIYTILMIFSGSLTLFFAIIASALIDNSD